MRLYVDRFLYQLAPTDFGSTEQLHGCLYSVYAYAIGPGSKLYIQSWGFSYTYIREQYNILYWPWSIDRTTFSIFRLFHSDEPSASSMTEQHTRIAAFVRADWKRTVRSFNRAVLLHGLLSLAWQGRIVRAFRCYLMMMMTISHSYFHISAYSFFSSSCSIFLHFSLRFGWIANLYADGSFCGSYFWFVRLWTAHKRTKARRYKVRKKDKIEWKTNTEEIHEYDVYRKVMDWLRANDAAFHLSSRFLSSTFCMPQNDCVVNGALLYSNEARTGRRMRAWSMCLPAAHSCWSERTAVVPCAVICVLRFRNLWKPVSFWSSALDQCDIGSHTRTI